MTTTMTGTKKQVAWATDIRAQVMANVEHYLGTVAAQPGRAIRLSDGDYSVDDVLTAINAEMRADFWINHRGYADTSEQQYARADRDIAAERGRNFLNAMAGDLEIFGRLKLS